MDFNELTILLLKIHIIIILIDEAQFTPVENIHHDEAKGNKVVPAALSHIAHWVYTSENETPQKLILLLHFNMLSLFV